MSKKRYIHNYEKSYAHYKEKLKNSKKISKKNKELISKFDKDCFLKENISLPTRIKYYDVLMALVKNLNKDFDKFDKSDFEDMVEKIENRNNITVSTKQKYRAIIKKFGRWLVNADSMFNRNGYKEYPDTVAWINTNIKKKDKPLIKASDILTEEEIDKLIDCADHPRDKAFVSVLYETGSRIGELGDVTINDVSEHEHGLQIDLAKGKTGTRNVIVIFHASKLTNWLNQHPLRDDRNAPLWVSVNNDKTNGKKKGKQLSYSALKKVIQRCVDKSMLKKRIYPHLFRHSRVTHLLNNNELNESLAKVYFGWTPDSKMLANYSHLTSKDANKAMLRIAGIKEDDKKVKKVKTCGYCNKHNDPSMKYCGFCGKPLVMETIYELEEMRHKISDLSIGFAKSGKGMEEYFREIIKKEMKKSK